MTSVKKRIVELKNILDNHNIAYYVHDNPTISDYEYDMILRELESLENEYPEFKTSDSPTQRVGSTPIDFFDSIVHSIPMLSLSNAMNEVELENFNSQVKKFLNTKEQVEYVAEPKLDGLAVELVYEQGFFQ